MYPVNVLYTLAQKVYAPRVVWIPCVKKDQKVILADVVCKAKYVLEPIH